MHLQNLQSANQVKTRLETLCRVLQQERSRLNGLLEEYRSRPLPNDKGEEEVPRILREFDRLQLEKAQKETSLGVENPESEGKDKNDPEKSVKNEEESQMIEKK